MSIDAPELVITEEGATWCDYCGEWDLVGSHHEVGEPCPEWVADNA